jgi:hypothetical protein
MVAAACGGGDSSNDTAPESTTTTSAPTTTAAPTTTEPARPSPVFDPADDHLMLAPVPPRPADKPEDFPTPNGSDDFMALFEPGAPWATALDQLTGFKIHSWMIRHYLTDDELVTIDTFLRDAGIPLMIEAEPLDPPDPAVCEHSESFEGPYEIENLQRLADLDVHVAAISFEQPYTYGVLWTGPGRCEYTLERTVLEVADWIAEVKEIYPDSVVGSIEGLWLDHEDPVANYATWLDGFEEITGEPLPFIYVDVDWRRPDWVEVLRGIEAVADERGIPFGVLYNGTLGSAATSEEWLQLTAERVAAYEAVGGGTPQHVSLQSWADLPDVMLPDDDVGAFTHLLRRYVGERSDIVDLRVETVGEAAEIVGSVVGSDGAPLAGQRVELGIIPDHGTPVTALHTGVVPDDVDQALVMVRVHAEGALIGDTDVEILDIVYTEDDGTENRVPDAEFAGGVASWFPVGDPVGTVVVESDGSGGRQLAITASPEQQVLINGGAFPVTPGAQYTFTVVMTGTETSVDAAGVAVGFLLAGEPTVETERVTLSYRLRPSEAGSAVSDERGEFRAPAPSATGGYDVVATVVGDAETWPITRVVTVS